MLYIGSYRRPSQINSFLKYNQWHPVLTVSTNNMFWDTVLFYVYQYAYIECFITNINDIISLYYSNVIIYSAQLHMYQYVSQ